MNKDVNTKKRVELFHVALGEADNNRIKLSKAKRWIPES